MWERLIFPVEVIGPARLTTMRVVGFESPTGFVMTHDVLGRRESENWAAVIMNGLLYKFLSGLKPVL